MHPIPYERYAGSVPVPTAVYRPANVGGIMAALMTAGVVPVTAVGVAEYSALAILEDRRKQAKTRYDALVATGESAASAEEALASLQATADERASLLAEIDGLDPQIAEQRSRREREASASTVTESQITEKAQEAAAKTADKPPTPFTSLGEQLRAVYDAAISQKEGRAIDPRLTMIQDWWKVQGAAHGATTNVGSDGGFLVQVDYNNELLTDIIAAGRLANLTTSREVGANSNGIKFNVFDETSRATGSRYGGVRAYWLAEAGQKTASRPKMRQIEIVLQKMAAMYVATDELLADTTALESFVRPAFVEEMAFVLDDSLIRGTGAGMPLGILNSDALVSVSKESGQPADTLVLENVDKMLVRIMPGTYADATWYINQELFPQIWQLAQVIGTGGVPAYIPPGGASGSPYGTLRGRPVVPTEYNSAIGDLGDIILADWSKYILVRKGGIEQASSIHVYFDTDETAFRWVLRVNGRPARSTSLTPYKGTGTLSPFVTLQAR